MADRSSSEKNGITLADKKVMTPKFRVSFPALDKPRSFKGAEPKFEVTMLFDKKTDLSAPVMDTKGKQISVGIRKAAENAIIEKYGTDKTKWPSRTRKDGKRVSAIKLPFRDGDKEKPDQKGYENTIFVRAWSKQDNPPGVVDRDQKYIDPKELYAGSYARATLIAFCYEFAGKIGVGFSLQNLQKLGDGEKFGGKRAAAAEFDVAEDESDLPENYDRSLGTGDDDDDDEDSDGKYNSNSVGF